MYCKKCGGLLDDNVHFCPKCGMKTEDDNELEFVEFSNAENFTGPIIRGVFGIIAGLIFFIIASEKEYQWNQSYSSYRTQVTILSIFGLALMGCGVLMIISNVYKSKKAKNPGNGPTTTKICPSCSFPLKYNVKVCPKCKNSTMKGGK